MVTYRIPVESLIPKKINEEDLEYLFHADALTAFNDELYSNIFTEETITTNKKAITINGRLYYGFFLEKGRVKYFLPTNFENKFPFKILKATEKDYKSDVFQFIQEIKPIAIPAEKRMTFRELIDNFTAFKHTAPKHFLLYKIASLAAYVDRVNFRVSTISGFGKDSVINTITGLVNSTVNIYGATFAKLEYTLMNKLMVINELGNLKKDDMVNMQEFLLAVGAYFNSYTKRSRKTATTQEQYDISKLSLIILYNLPEYYTNKGQQYFDQMFTKAVINRFIPFVFDGKITTSFEKLLDFKGVVNRNRDVYKNVIATINYYRQNNIKDIKYEVDTNVIKFPDYLKRYERSLNIILKYVAEYCESQEEFDDLSKELFKCHLAYQKQIEGDKVEIKPIK
jgi:hypothetical protein